MKILINCSMPFTLAHGGQAIQIMQTMAALAVSGVQVEPLRWWDENQSADLLHYFGRMPVEQIKLAQKKGMKVVFAEFLTAQGSRTASQLRLQKTINRALARIAPRNFIAAFNWDAYRLADACIALTPWEANLMSYLFDAPAERIQVVGNGIEEIFLNAPKVERKPWLVCTTTLTERKRVLELAQAAVRAQTPCGSSAGPTRRPIPTRNNFSPWLNSIRKSSATKGPFPTGLNWHGFIEKRAALCY